MKFSYEGETLVHTVRKTDIRHITFGSGRVERFNVPVEIPQVASANVHLW